jgi:hypothetical protein
MVASLSNPEHIRSVGSVTTEFVIQLACKMPSCHIPAIIWVLALACCIRLCETNESAFKLKLKFESFVVKVKSLLGSPDFRSLPDCAPFA